MHSPRSVIEQLRHWFPPVLGILLLGVSMWAIRQELRQHSPQEIWDSLQAIPPKWVGMAMLFTGLNYWALTGYDTLAIRYVGYALPYRKTALVAIISYAISNTVGLALLSGSALRYRFYSSWGLSSAKIAQIIAFCNLSFWLGLFTVGGVLFTLEPIAVPTLLKLPFSSVYPLGIVFLGMTLAYLGWSFLGFQSWQIGKWTLPHLPIQFSLAQIAITALDWLLATAVLYVLLPSTNSLSFAGFFGIYLLAQLAGLISNIPGGLGVFETVMLMLISPPLPAHELLGALLAYRGIYYLLPLTLALLLLGGYEIAQRYSVPRH
ncbi:MAG: lysylphosphatidylglycerol synthase domain-containing protein [Thermostichales cyanobacterium DRC_bins_46]